MTDAPDTAAATGPIPKPRTYVLGFVALGVCIGATGMLVLHHLVGMTLPGCGPGSNCARAASSSWGSTTSR